MKFVIDTNIIIAALVKDSFARKIILLGDAEFISPDFSIDEINKYKELILEKSGMTEKEFAILLSTLLERINIIPEFRYESYLEEANKLIGNIGLKDVPFIALALSMENDGIWSEDKHFQKQGTVKIWKTEEIKDMV